MDDLGGLEVCGACTFMFNQQNVLIFHVIFLFIFSVYHNV